MSTSLDYELNRFASVFAGSMCWVGVVVFIGWMIAIFVFSPLHERTFLFRVNSRFCISDLIVLAVHLQLAAALMMAIPQGRAVKTALILTACLVLSFWWITGVRMLARAGIDYTWHRWLFLGIVMPIGYGASSAIVVMIVLVPMSLLLLVESGASGDWGEFSVAVGTLVGAGFAFAAAVACRRTSRLLVERARASRARKDGIKFEDAGTVSPVKTAHSAFHTLSECELFWTDESTEKPRRDHEDERGTSECD